MVAVAKVAQIFRRFDNDRDRYLNYEEVKALEWEVSRQELSTANYVALCEAVVADPDRGLDEQVRRSENPQSYAEYQSILHHSFMSAPLIEAFYPFQYLNLQSLSECCRGGFRRCSASMRWASRRAS